MDIEQIKIGDRIRIRPGTRHTKDGWNVKDGDTGTVMEINRRWIDEKSKEFTVLVYWNSDIKEWWVSHRDIDPLNPFIDEPL